MIDCGGGPSPDGPDGYIAVTRRPLCFAKFERSLTEAQFRRFRSRGLLASTSTYEQTRQWTGIDLFITNRPRNRRVLPRTMERPRKMKGSEEVNRASKNSKDTRRKGNLSRSIDAEFRTKSVEDSIKKKNLAGRMKEDR